MEFADHFHGGRGWFCPHCHTHRGARPGVYNDPPKCPKCGNYMLHKGVTFIPLR